MARNDWRCEEWRLRPNPVPPALPVTGANLEETPSVKSFP
jgi:hypothetical protein